MLMNFASYYASFFCWMPMPLLIGFGALIGMMLLFLVLKIVAFILDCIPFL